LKISLTVTNVLQRDFKVDKSSDNLITDITEFSIPTGKAYLSPKVECFNGAIIGF